MSEHHNTQGRASFFVRLVLILGAASSASLSFWMTRQAFVPLPVDALEATQRVSDLGSVAQGDIPTHFELWNLADKPIQISHVAKSCRCAKVEFSSKRIEASGKSIVDVVWDTRGMRGKHENRFVVYYSVGDEIGIKEIPLRVRADVTPMFDYEPIQLKFPSSKDGHAEMHLTSRRATSPVKILDAKCSHPALKVASLTDRSVAVNFNPKLWPKAARLSAKLVFTTDCATEATVTVPINVIDEIRDSNASLD